MKKIKFEVCNGLDNIVIANKKTKPPVAQGAGFVLLHKGIEIHVVIKAVSEDGNTYFGKILEIGEDKNIKQELCIGEIVLFKYENISYPLSPEKSIS